MWPARDTRNRRGGSCRSRFAIYRMRLLRYTEVWYSFATDRIRGAV
jgi:hypothetical protein